MGFLKSTEYRKKGINKDIDKIKKGTKEYKKQISNLSKEFTSLPWTKLPIQGWACLLIVLLFLIILLVFVVPGINNF